MARPSNQDHVARTLRALSILRSEPGWHHVTRLAEVVGAKPDRLSADLRRCCYAADDWHLPLLFGSDIEPEHLDGDAVVQLAPDVPLTLPLPSSRVDVIRLALLAGSAARREPDHQSATVLRALEQRLNTILDADNVDVRDQEPALAASFRSAIRRVRQVRFSYRSISDEEPATRTVVPIGVHRQGRWWLLSALPADLPTERTDPTSYRLDRIIGEVEDAGPATGEKRRDGPPAPHIDSTQRSAVQLRLHENDLWAVDDLSPSAIEQLHDELVHVRISLYPPVAERLSRVLFLTDPATTSVVDGGQFLDVHRRRVTEGR